MTVRYVFVPEEMRGLAADLRRAGDGLQAAGLPLIRAQLNAGELPPEARGPVESQCRSIWKLLDAGGESLAGGARHLDRTAAAVEQADSSSWRAAGLKVTKVGKAVVTELADRGSAKPADPAGRARRWAGVLGTLTGVGAIGAALGWAEWRRALREAKVSRGSPAARKLSAGLQRRVGEGVRENLGWDRRPVPYRGDDGFLRRLGRKATGYVPVAGDAADVAGYLAASEKLRRGEPQTGLAQAATDVRDFTDLTASSFHVAADALSKSIVTLPAAVPAEAVGIGGDAVVLGLDTANEARKALGTVEEQLEDGFESLVGIG
jgi:hypothetical protein